MNVKFQFNKCFEEIKTNLVISSYITLNFKDKEERKIE